MNPRCARCGAEVAGAGAYCPACGQPRPAARGEGVAGVVSSPPPRSEQAGDDRVRFVILVEAALAACVVGWLGFRSQQDDYAHALHPAPCYVDHPVFAGLALAATVLFWGRVLIALLRIEAALDALASRP